MRLTKIDQFKSNFRAVLLAGDISLLRLAISLGAIFWSVAGILISTFGKPVEAEFSFAFDIIPLPWYSFLFMVYGLLELSIVSTTPKSRFVRTMVSGAGVLLWTISLNLIIVANVLSDTFPLWGTHWTAVFASWWIFFRDCYGERNKHSE